MPIKQLNPYLNFNGTAEKAIKLYESALGARTENLQRFGDVPGSTPGAQEKNRVMHAVLRIGEGTIMISDVPPHTSVAPAGPVHVCLDFDDVSEMGRRFEALSAGGKVTQPLQDTFWGARFGMLTDAHGISWMFNGNLKKA
jgi:PhnB protein